MQRTIGRWLVEHDPDATRRCYARLPVGAGCACNQCRNFDAAIGQALPKEFRSLADALGLDVAKPADLCHWYRTPSGLHLTGGWYHFVGSVLAGEDVVAWSSGTGTFRFEELVPGLEFGLSARLALVRETFAGLPVVQLEFQVGIPWVLAEAEPA